MWAHQGAYWTITRKWGFLFSVEASLHYSAFTNCEVKCMLNKLFLQFSRSLAPRIEPIMKIGWLCFRRRCIVIEQGFSIMKEYYSRDQNETHSSKGYSELERDHWNINDLIWDGRRERERAWHEKIGKKVGEHRNDRAKSKDNKFDKQKKQRNFVMAELMKPCFSLPILNGNFISELKCICLFSCTTVERWKQERRHIYFTRVLKL